MTELEQKAEEYFSKTYANVNNVIDTGLSIKHSYIDGYRQGQKENECFPQKKDGTIDTCEVMKENEELKAQIERMKCCGNCKHTDSICLVCNCYNEWELAE